MKSFISRNYWLIIVLSFYFVLQLVFALNAGFVSGGADSAGYIILAKKAVMERALYPSTHNFIHPYIWNSGIINMTAVCLYFFHSLSAVLVLNCIFNTLSALFLFLLAKKLLNKNAAWISLLLYVTYLSHLGYISAVSSEVPFFFFIIGGLYFSIYKGKFYNLAGGALLAVANWFRPLLIVFLPALIWHLYREKNLKRLIPVGIGLVFVILLIGGEVYSRTGRFIYQANTSWFNMAMGCSDNALGTFNKDVFREGGTMYIENVDTMDYVQRNKIYKERIIKYVTAHPVKMLKQIPDRFVRLYSTETTNMAAFLTGKGMKNDAEIGAESAASTLWTKFPHYGAIQYMLLIVQIQYYFVLVCFVLGAWKAWKERKHSLTMPFLVICIGTATTMAVISINRYHHPYIPFMMIFAAYYLSELEFVKKRLSR